MKYLSAFEYNKRQLEFCSIEKTENGFSFTFNNHFLYTLNTSDIKLAYAQEDKSNLYIPSNPDSTLSDADDPVYLILFAVGLSSVMMGNIVTFYCILRRFMYLSVRRKTISDLL